MTAIAVLDDYQSVAADLADWGALPAGCDVTFFPDHVADEDGLAERLAPFDAVFCMRERTPITRTLLARLPTLRLIVTAGMRNAAIDLDAAREHGVVVSGCEGLTDNTVELTWALILGLVRWLPVEDASLRAGLWQTTVGVDLKGRTLGLLGLGRLGREVARIGQAFGMHPVAWSPNLTDDQAAEVGARRVEKDELFATADVLTVHLVLGDRSRGLVGDAELGLMKPTAYLVNTSRGPIVDEAALVRALHSGQIAGAALDVYDVEPLPADSPLRTAPNTVLTPHLGFVTEQTYRSWYAGAIAAMTAFLAGEPINVLT